MIETVRNKILGQRLVGMLTYMMLTSAARECHTGRLVLLKAPQVVVGPRKQPELIRTPCIIQFDPLYNSNFLYIILEGILIALC